MSSWFIWDLWTLLWGNDEEEYVTTADTEWQDEPPSHPRRLLRGGRD